MTIEPGRLEPHPTEWPIAKQLWQWALEGRRLGEILNLADEAGYRRRNGKPWIYSALYRLFDSQVYAGMVPYGHFSGNRAGKRRVPDAGEWYRGNHPPMITLEEWYTVQELLQRGNTKQRPRRKARGELIGLLRCSLCGAPTIVDSVSRDGKYSYCCSACHMGARIHQQWTRRSWIIHLALQQVLEEVVSMFPTLLPDDQSEEHRANLENEITALKRQLKRIRDLYRLGEYNDDLDEYLADKRKIEQQIATKEAAIRNMSGSSDQLRPRYEALCSWHIAYEAAGDDILAKQRLWRAFIEQAETDGNLVRVRLVDLGPNVAREWEIHLPPRGIRQPGTWHGPGIVGKAKDGRLRGYLHKNQGPFHLTPIKRETLLPSHNV